jgi:acyl-CoA synthetase (AMP-forming)/AMP-acid ligase II
MHDSLQSKGWHSDVPLSVLLSRAVQAQPMTRMHFYTEEGVTSITTSGLIFAGRQLARGLRAIGLQRGDAIAMQLPTTRDTAALYLAALEIGAVLVPIVHIYGPAEVGFILRQSRARFLCVPERWRGIDFLARVDALGPLPDLERVIVRGERTLPGGITLKAIETLAETTCAATSPMPQVDDVCLLLYTSGTTAAPKGVRHTHRTVGAEWLIPFVDVDAAPEEPAAPAPRGGVAALGRPGGGGPYLTPFPAGHIAGFNFLLRPFVTGTDMVFMDRWDARLAAELVERHRVRLSGGTPFHLQGLLDAAKRDGRDLSSLASYSMGGTGVTPEHVAAADRAGFAGSRSYGLTEHSTVSVGWRDMPFEQRAQTDGRLQPGSEVRIVDELERELPLGTDGEILVRGPELFIGYTDAALNAQAFTTDGWFRTGDIGRLDSANCLTLTDRKKDIVIRGGENISSQEVERVLATHPAVQDVAVVAQPDPRYGEKVCAFVVLHSGGTLDLAGVQEHFAAAGVARQKTPEGLHLVNELPRTASGKVKKGELRERARA